LKISRQRGKNPEPTEGREGGRKISKGVKIDYTLSETQIMKWGDNREGKRD